MRKWIESFKPKIGPDTILTYKEAYSTEKPDYGMPNLINVISRQISGRNHIINYLNRSAVIEYKYMPSEGYVVTFTPNIAKSYKDKKVDSKLAQVRDYVFLMVVLTGLFPNYEMDKMKDSVYVPLSNQENVKKMRYIAPYLEFEKNNKLTKKRLAVLQRQALQRTK